MAAVALDLVVYRGGTTRLAVAVCESDGTAADLTGYTGEMQLRARPDSDDPLDAATVTIDTATGVVTAVLDAASTDEYDFTAAVYDLRILSGSTVEYIAAGKATIRETVTR